MMTFGTAEFKLRLAKYNIVKESGIVDPYVDAVLTESLDGEVLNKLRNYSRSGYSVNLHVKNFMTYNRLMSQEKKINLAWQSDPYIQRAIQRVESELAPLLSTVQTWTADEINKVSFVGSSAAGHTYYGKKRDNYPLALSNASRAINDFKKYGDNYHFTANKAFARCHLSTLDDPKIRHVWGQAFHNQLIEGLVAEPIMDMLKKNDTSIYYGRNIYKEMPSDVRLLEKESGYTFYGMDFSRFDASVCSYAVSTAWDILERNLCIRDKTVFLFSRQLFEHTPVILPTGELYIVHTGIPSGSMFTSLIDSIVNMFLVYAVIDRFNLQDVHRIRVLGDDSAFFSSTRVSHEEIALYYDSLGMSLSPKTIISQLPSDTYFLGHNFLGSHLKRDDFILLSLALFPEDPVLSAEDSVLRLAGLLLDSGLNSAILYDLYHRVIDYFAVDVYHMKQQPLSIASMFNIL
jgi:hypothetical protein